MGAKSVGSLKSFHIRALLFLIFANVWVGKSGGESETILIHLF